MKKYILDTFQIPLNEEESKKYFFRSIKEMNMLERKIYLKNERKYFKFLKILFRRNKKFILKIKNFYDFGIDNLFKREQKILKRELKKINKYNFKFKNLISIDKKYLEIFLKISYRDVFGHLNRYKIFFPKDKIYITSITDYHYIIIFLDDNKKKEIIKIANRCKLFIELLHQKIKNYEKFELKPLKSGDILGGIASTTNTITGIVSGLASNQGTKLPTSAVNKNNSNDDNDDDKNNQSLDNFYHRFLTYDEKSKILNSVKENKQVFATRDIVVYF